ncbi:MAG: translocation/assembly module TamB domain-containing protein, partial [Acetobacteraceae bacterium]
FTVEHPLLQASGRMEFAAAQHLTARLTVPELAPFSVLAGVAAQGQASLAVTAMREAGTTHIALDGRLGLTGGPAAAIATLGSNATIAAAATYTAAGLALQRLQIIGRDLTFDAHGAIASARLDLVWQAALARLEPLDRRFAGHVNAAGRVFGPADNLALTADLSGMVATDDPRRRTSPLAPPGEFTAHFALAGLPGAPHGSLDAGGEVLGAPLQLALNAARAADGTLTIAIRHAAWKSASADGSLRLPAGTGLSSGLPIGDVRLAVAKLGDFAPLLGHALTGSLSADLRTTAERAVLSAESHGTVLPGVAAVGDAHLRASLAAPANNPVASKVLDAQLTLSAVRASGIDGTLRLDASGPLAAPALRLVVTSPRLDGATLGMTAAGQADLARRSLTLTALDARWHGRSLRLLAPTKLALGADGALAITGLRANLAGGILTADGRVGRALAVTASLRRLPAGLVALVTPSLPADGLLSAELQLTGPLARPVGTIHAQGSGLRLLTGPGRALPPGRLEATATLAGTTARLTSRFAAGSSHLVVAGTIGGSGGLNAGAPMALRADGTIDLALMNPLLAAEGEQVGGQFVVAATVGGALDAPHLGGTAQLTGGDLRDEVHGVHLRDLAGRFTAAGDSLRIVTLTGRAGAGTIGADGTMDLLRPGLPVALRFTARNATLLSGGVVTADLDADLTLRGDLRPAATVPGAATPAVQPGSGGSKVAEASGAPAVPREPAGPGGPVGSGATAGLSGTVRVRSATIRIPNQLPASVQTIPVRYAGAPRPAVTTGAAVSGAAVTPLALALRVVAPQRIFVRGRGLNAELGGTVELGGSLAQMQPRGGFRLIRGAFNLVGQTLTFTSGEIRFAGGSLADPTLHLVASTTTGDTTATLIVGGTASAPKITLTSVPELPQDQILAQLLFHTGSGNLTPLQLASVAAGLAELSGGAGSLPNPLEALRGALGLDQLGVGSGASGAPTLQAGRYIGRRLYVGAAQGANQQSTQGTVTYDLTKRLQLHATAGTGETTSAIGASGQTNGESVGIRFQVQY